MIMRKKFFVINVSVSHFLQTPFLEINIYFFAGKLKFHFVICIINFIFLLTTNLRT